MSNELARDQENRPANDEITQQLPPDKLGDPVAPADVRNRAVEQSANLDARPNSNPGVLAGQERGWEQGSIGQDGVGAGELPENYVDLSKRGSGDTMGPPSPALVALGADAHVPAGSLDLSKVSRLEKAPVPDAPGDNLLDNKLFESEGYQAANSFAKANFDNVVVRPGHVFVAAGLYRNVNNLDERFLVERGDLVPDDLFLIGENNLVGPSERNRLLGRRVS